MFSDNDVFALCPVCQNLVCECPTYAEKGKCFFCDKDSAFPLTHNGMCVVCVEESKIQDYDREDKDYIITKDDAPLPGPKALEIDTLSLSKPLKVINIIPTRICEICSNEGDWFKHSGMYMCPSCRDKEIELHLKNAASSEKRVAEQHTDMLLRSNEAIIDRQPENIDEIVKDISEDTGVAIKSDIFNAKTTSIIDVKAAIDADPSVIQKNYALAATLKDRFLHLRKTLFDIDEARVSITSEQRSIQVFLNDLSHKLRSEEREKLKLADLSYTPNPPKLVKTKGVKKPAKVKFDKTELERVSKEINIPTFTIQAMCVAQGKTPAQVGAMLKGLQESL